MPRLSLPLRVVAACACVLMCPGGALGQCVASVSSDLCTKAAPAPPERFSAAALTPIVERQVRLELAAQSAQAVSTPERRKHDSVWNGVLIGAGTGALAGGVLGLFDQPSCEGGQEYVCIEAAGLGVIIGATFGLIVGGVTGAIVDKMH